MSVVSTSFNKYKIAYYSTHTIDTLCECEIYCYLDAAIVGRIRFFKEETADTSLTSQVIDGTAYLNYRLSRFGDVMQILLHDKPLNLYVNSDTNVGYISNTGVEPIGEEEPA